MKKYTQQEIENYRAYEAVRSRGAYNMFSPQAMAATGLNKAEYIFVMKNYVELQEEANQ